MMGILVLPPWKTLLHSFFSNKWRYHLFVKKESPNNSTAAYELSGAVVFQTWLCIRITWRAGYIMLGPSWGSDSAGLGWDPRIWIAKLCPGDTSAVVLGLMAERSCLGPGSLASRQKPIFSNLCFVNDAKREKQFRIIWDLHPNGQKSVAHAI